MHDKNVCSLFCIIAKICTTLQSVDNKSLRVVSFEFSFFMPALSPID